MTTKAKQVNLESRVRELAAELLPAAIETLTMAVRIPDEYIRLDVDQGGDVLCGTSNHEGPRIEYLLRRLLEVGAVETASDAGIDEFGNLWWKVEDPADGVAPENKTVIYLDGHVDTVAALRSRWLELTNGGIDAYLGLIDPDRVDFDRLQQELGYLPKQDERQHLVWGRGTADQLAGVVSQIFATAILRRLRSEGALEGVIVWSYATVAEEDNDGGAPMFYVHRALESGAPERQPDVVILSEPTGSARHGALGIYRGQRGRMQIEVEVVGKSSHGSMPHEGKNPLEYGAAIVVEAAAAAEQQGEFAHDDFLGSGTRTTSTATLVTPSDCAVPEVFTFRLDRRLTLGEDPQQALEQIERLPAVQRARDNGLSVTVRVPRYESPTWRGYKPGNSQIYPSWSTPADHPAIRAAEETYRAAITPMVEAGTLGSSARAEPRVARWVFSTDGVGVPVAAEHAADVGEAKRWVDAGALRHPALFGLGPGVEENTHKIGECVDSREIAATIAFLATYPAIFRHHGEG
ncbi:MAG: M20/M25/M40 family metallo-hydrolase [Acidobacteriota bacterium]